NWLVAVKHSSSTYATNWLLCYAAGMARDAEATRARILDAAEAEFATYGIAGARVDRIAETAPANKALIYKYFGTKDELFDAVFAARALAFVDQAEFAATDLPG